MNLKIRRLGVVYERTFSSLAFELPADALGVLKQLYAALSPIYSLRPIDLSAVGGNLLSDVVLRIFLGGSSHIEATVEKFRASFDVLNSQDDIDTAKKLILASEKVLEGALEGWADSNVTLTANLWFECADDRAALEKLLATGQETKIKLAMNGVNVERTFSPFELNFVNETENWHFRARFEKSLIPSADLFISIDGNYLKGSKYEALDERGDHMESIFRQILDNLELTLD